MAEKPAGVNRLRSASICGHEPPATKHRRQFSTPRGGLTATWRILAALIAVVALLAPVRAQAPAGESAQATLSLSAVLSGGAPLTGGLRWRVFGSQADPDGSHPLIVESGQAQPTLTVPPGEYVVHVAFGLASAAKRVSARRRSSLRTADSVGGRASDRRHAGRHADRPVKAVSRDLRPPEPQSARQARLRQGQGRRYRRTAGRLLSYRIDLPGHGWPPFGRERADNSAKSAMVSRCGDPLQFGGQRRHQGRFRQAARRHHPPSLRDAHTQACQ